MEIQTGKTNKANKRKLIKVINAGPLDMAQKLKKNYFLGKFLHVG